MSGANFNIVDRGMRSAMRENSAYARPHPQAGSLSDWLGQWRDAFNMLTGQPSQEEQQIQNANQLIQTQMQKTGQPFQKAMVSVFTQHPDLWASLPEDAHTRLLELAKMNSPDQYKLGGNESIVEVGPDGQQHVVASNPIHTPKAAPSEIQTALWATGAKDINNPTPAETAKAQAWFQKQHAKQPGQLDEMETQWLKANPGATSGDFWNAMVSTRTGGLINGYDPSTPLPRTQEAQAQAVAKYKMPMPAVSGFGAGKAVLQNIVARANYLAGVNGEPYDVGKYQQHTATSKSFAGGGKDYQTLTAIGAAVQHLGVAQEYAKALNNGNVQLINKWGNAWKQAFGAAPPTDMKLVGQILSQELNKVISGGSTSAEAERLNAVNSVFNTATSPKQIEDGANAALKLMAGQANSRRSNYVSTPGMEPGDFDKLFPLLTPGLKQFGYVTDNSGQSSPAGQNSSAAPAPAQGGSNASPAPANNAPVQPQTNPQPGSGGQGAPVDVTQFQHQAVGPDGKTTLFSQDGKSWFNQDGSPYQPPQQPQQ